MIKKICFVILNRANYGSIKSLLTQIKKDKKFKLQIIVGASAILDKYGSCEKIIKKDGLKINYKIDMQTESNQPKNMAQTVGIGLMGLPEAFSKLKPNLVFTVGDRFETMATVISASYMNIPIAHTMGGELTGTIDESIRHAITKFSHLHFVSNYDAKRRIVKMGEPKENVYNVGCPRIDEVKKILKNKINLKKTFNFINYVGVGDKLDINKKFLLVSQHPVTTEYEKSKSHMLETLKALSKINIQCLFLWPNPDAGSDIMSKEIRKWREKNNIKKIRFVKNLPLEIYVSLLNHCSCMIGNSSSALREGSFIGVPAVNIGSRQNKRLTGKNIINCKNDEKKILSSIIKQIKKGKYKKEVLYGNGSAAKRIIGVLKKIKKMSIQKVNSY